MICISDKTDFKTKDLTRDKGLYIRIKGSIQHENITLVNIYAPNVGVLKFIKQILTDIKGKIDSITVIVGNFNTLLASMIDHPERKSTRNHEP